MFYHKMLLLLSLSFFNLHHALGQSGGVDEKDIPQKLPIDGIGERVGLSEKRYNELLEFSKNTKNKLMQILADTANDTNARNIILKGFEEIYYTDNSYDILPVKIVIKRAVDITIMLKKEIPEGYPGREKMIDQWVKRSLLLAVDYSRYDLKVIREKFDKTNLVQESHPFLLFALEYSLFLESFEQVLTPFARLRYDLAYLNIGFLINDLNLDVGSNHYAALLIALDRHFRSLPNNCQDYSKYGDADCAMMRNESTFFRLKAIAPYIEKYDLLLSGKYYQPRN